VSTVVGDELDPRIIDAARSIEQQVFEVVLGKEAQVRLAVAALLGSQHLLLDDLPGVGKTTLGSALARVVGGTMGRIQGTPDLLPTDLTGSSVFDQRTGEWRFRPGPLHSNVVLVDELNRITPRTQSALLEAMAEDHITVDGVSRPTPVPFLVVATMNPVGTQGTFALTTGQLDRFGATLRLGQADRATERRLLRGDGGRPAVGRIEPVIPVELLPELQAIVAEIHVADAVLDYVLDLCEWLRLDTHLSIRAPQSLLAMARGLAVLHGRSFVVPDDVKTLADPCLAHRLVQEGQPVDGYRHQVGQAIEDLPVRDVVIGHHG
jgi:MoxR-like ATPase